MLRNQVSSGHDKCVWVGHLNFFETASCWYTFLLHIANISRGIHICHALCTICQTLSGVILSGHCPSSCILLSVWLGLNFEIMILMKIISVTIPYLALLLY